MGNFASDTIKVVDIDMMCFRADPKTLEPLGCSFYDPYAFAEPDTAETIKLNEWYHRRNVLFEGEQNGTMDM